MAWWIAAMRTLAPLDESDVSKVADHLTAEDLPVGGEYLRPGDRPRRVGIVQSGIVREMFVKDDGSERTRGFAVVGDFAGSLSDLLRGGPARTGVVAEVASRVLSLPWSVVEHVTSAPGPWRELLHRATERLYLAKADREYELLALDAEARYAAFRARHPLIEASVTQRHVASYLGITPEHLSRIRTRERRARSS